MTVSGALRQGAARLAAVQRPLWIFYAAATSAALLVTAVLMSVASESLGHSLWAPGMLANFDLEWPAELVARYGGIAAMPIVYTILGLFALFAGLYLFLLGGALEVLCAGGESFFGGCGRHFWSLLRLTVWSGLCALVPLLAGSVLGTLGSKLWGEGSAATPLVYWGWFRLAVVLAGLAAVNLVFDYAAISMAVEDSRQSLRAIARAFEFVASNPRSIFSLAAALWLLLALVIGLGAGISRMAAPTLLPAVIALFLFRQLVVIAKTWFWLLFLPAQAALWTALRPAQWAMAPPAGATVQTPPATSAGNPSGTSDGSAPQAGEPDPVEDAALAPPSPPTEAG